MAGRIERWGVRAQRLLAPVQGRRTPLLDDDAALRTEALRLLPRLEEVAGRPYGRLPHIGYRRGLEARFAGPWSQYLTLGTGVTRVIRMTSWESSRPAIPAILAHELAHRYGFDESVTTLRGLEVSAREAEGGDARHEVAVRWELARLLVGAAMHEALATGQEETFDTWLRGAAGAPFVRSARHWERLCARRHRRPDWALAVYAALPLAAIERADGCGASRSEPIGFPRFARDGVQAWMCTAYTAADAVSGRRRQTVPLDALLRLWRASGD